MLCSLLFDICGSILHWKGPGFPLFSRLYSLSQYMSFIPLGLMTIEYDMRKKDSKTNVGPHSKVDI